MACWRLREIAEPERWNARKIAAATGLAYNTVWNIWAGNSKRVDLDTLQALADLLRVAPGDLIGPDKAVARERPGTDSSLRSE